MNDSAVLRKNKEMVTRVIDGETLLIPIYKTSRELNNIYSLNKSATRIWNIIDGKKSLLEIKKQIGKEFDGSPREIDKKLSETLKELKKIKAII